MAHAVSFCLIGLFDERFERKVYFVNVRFRYHFVGSVHRNNGNADVYRVDVHVCDKLRNRTAAAKVLPEEIAFRKKLGFVVPIRMWMADERYNADVRAKFSSDYAAEFFNKDEINAIFEDYIGGNSDDWRKVYVIYAFLVWYEEYFIKR